jgi:hypothetical protein
VDGKRIFCSLDSVRLDQKNETTEEFSILIMSHAQEEDVVAAVLDDFAVLSCFPLCSGGTLFLVDTKTDRYGIFFFGDLGIEVSNSVKMLAKRTTTLVVEAQTSGQPSTLLARL